jgi:hypothetical protein
MVIIPINRLTYHDLFRMICATSSVNFASLHEQLPGALIFSSPEEICFIQTLLSFITRTCSPSRLDNVRCGRLISGDVDPGYSEPRAYSAHDSFLDRFTGDNYRFREV